MSLLTTIDGIPVYSTTEEAIAWGETFGLIDFHTHIFENQTGYMSGASHEDIDLVFYTLGINVNDVVDEEYSVANITVTTETQDPVVVSTPPTTTTTATVTTTTTSGSGY